MNPVLADPVFSFSRKDAYIQKWTAQLTLWDARVRRMSVRFQSRGDHAVLSQAEALQSKLHDAWVLLITMEQTSDGEWHVMREKTERVVADVGSTFHSLVKLHA